MSSPNVMVPHRMGEIRGPRGQAPGRDGHVSAASLFGCACFSLALIAYNFVDIDVWHQMALIRDSVAAGHLLRADVYAYVPTTVPWIDHEWGAGAIAYFGSAWFGGHVLVLLKFALALGTYFVCLQTARAAHADLRLFAACSPLAIFLMHLGFFSAVRAQAYTFFFTALLALTWRKVEQGSRLWVLGWLALFPLWVNLHAGFVAGIGLTALYCAEKFLRREPLQPLLLLTAGMLLETGLTPYGLSYFSYLHRALVMSRPYSAEWGAVWNLGPIWAVCFLAALLLTAYSVLAAGIRSTPGLLPLAATAVEAAMHRKLLPLFAIVWLSYTPSYLQHSRLGRFSLGFMERRRRFLLTAWIVLSCVSVVAAIRQRAWQLRVEQPIYPVGPVRFLAEHHARGKLLVPFRLGAYVSWRLYPAIKVSLDSRYEEVFSNDVMKATFDFYEARAGWQRILSAFPPDLILVPRDAPVERKMTGTGYARIYHDRQFDIFASPGNSLPPADWSELSFSDTFP